MKILVTGGAGFIGSHVVDLLLNIGHKVVLIDNLSTGRIENVNNKAKLYKLDISNPEINLVFKKEKFDAVFHLAASTNVRKSIENPFNDIKTNILGSINLFEVCRKNNVKKIIFSSTGGALYGDAGVIPTPETYLCNPISPYGVDKLTVEKYLFYYHKVHDFSAVILRYSNVYGPRQDKKNEGGVVTVFLKNMLAHKPVNISGKGSQTRDFVYVRDVARANILSLKKIKKKSFNVYNISTKKEISIKNLFKKISKKTNLNLKPVYTKRINGEVDRSSLDNSLAKKELLWDTSYDIDMGVDEMVKYLKAL